MESGHFYSAGKLLISGEYLLLYGARGLAVPLKKGQHMKVSPGESPSLVSWHARVLGQQWFNAEYKLPGLEIRTSSDPALASFLGKILQACSSSRPDRFTAGNSYEIHTDLEFDVRWGLGSSSSLLSNLAWWLDLDPYYLFQQVFPGSGYDVFCARAVKPVVFQLKEGVPIVSEVDFDPVFSPNLFLVYLGEKQDTQSSVSRFKIAAVFTPDDLDEISHLTALMVHSTSLEEFMHLLDHHEKLMSGILKMPPVKASRFSDFPGSIKSLGAWGGDFILAASPLSALEISNYFNIKGLKVILNYNDLVS